MPHLPTAPGTLEDLKERIELFLLELKHPVLTEPGKELVDLSSSSYSLSTSYHKLLWHVWNENTNLVRQITAIQKESGGRMELRYQKFGKGPPGVMTIAESRAGAEQLQRRSARVRYAQTFRRILAQLFPQWQVAEVRSEQDLEHSFSGLYTRAVLKKGQQAWAVIGSGDQEDAQAAENILTYGLLWLDWVRRRDTNQVFEGLKVFVPSRRSATTLQRLAWMDPGIAKWEVYETGDKIRRLDPADVGNLKITFAQAGRPIPMLTGSAASGMSSRDRFREQVLAFGTAVETHWGPGDLLTFSINGLAFAKETAKGIVFGVGGAETLLTDDNGNELERLVNSLAQLRRAESRLDVKKRLHPFYRLQPEKWMQSRLVRETAVLGYDLVSDALYEQVSAHSGLERGLMDLLAVTSAGRLLVAEFKASEDIQVPLQALDYWMQVRAQQERGELERQGYFTPGSLSSDPPLLLLVCPALQFHSTCETILHYFSPAVEVIRVGLNQEWRERLHVVFRMGRNFISK